MAKDIGRTDSTAAMMSLVSAYGADDRDDDEPSDPVDPDGVDKISGSEDEDEAPQKGKGQKRPPESEEDTNPRPPKVERRVYNKLVSYAADEADEDREEEDVDEDEDKEKPLVDYNISYTTEATPAKSEPIVRGSQIDDVQLPPEPPGKCSNRLQELIAKKYEKIQMGGNLNNSIQRRKDFRNPSIYEKLVQYCAIDEKGTNYPPELYDPSIWGPESFYDELAKAQKIEMDKREKEKKDRTKIEFVTGTKKTADGTEPKRKSKWDTQAPIVMTGVIKPPSLVTTAILNPPTISITTSASGTKTTVISAVGSIKKQK